MVGIFLRIARSATICGFPRNSGDDSTNTAGRRERSSVENASAMSATRRASSASTPYARAAAWTELSKLQRTRRRVPQYPDGGQRRNGLDEQLQAFCTEIGKIQEHARDVPARASKACDHGARNRITLEIERNYGMMAVAPREASIGGLIPVSAPAG